MRRTFAGHFGGEPLLFRAPARVNLIGEHTDYNGGLVMPLNTALHTWVAARPRSDGLVRAHSARFDETVELAAGPDAGVTRGHWSGYLAGVVLTLLDEGFPVTGADLLIDGDIPLGGGLASSASLETALAAALLKLAGRDLDPLRLALLCQRAENERVGTRCGIMDPFVIAACPRGHAIRLDCRSLESEALPLPGGAGLLVVDCGVRHSLQDGAYNRRRLECEAAAAKLSVTSLSDATPADLEAGRQDLNETEYRRAHHVLSENRRVLEAAECLWAGDLRGLGRLLDASHASLRDDYGVSCAELDCLAEIARACPGVLGARMVGGGFGGCVIALVERTRMDSAERMIASEYGAWAGREPWRHVVAPADPAGLVGAPA